MIHHQYDPLVLFSEMPSTQPTVTVTEAPAVVQKPAPILPYHVFEIDGHPFATIYKNADDYKDAPDLGHC
jgi:hypothetical protein